MPAVLPTDVTALMPGPATTDQVEAVLSVVQAMVRAYVRDNGFHDDVPNDQLAAVVKSAAVRWLANPSQLANTVAMGGFTVSYQGGFDGFTIGERIVLDRFRLRAK
jgi:hypothetical protein